MLRRKWISGFIVALLILAGLCLLGSIALPYSALKSLADSLQPDHNFNSLKPWNAVIFKMIFGVSGLFFLGLAALTAFHRWNLIIRVWKRFWLDARRSFGFLHLNQQELVFPVVVLVVTFLAVVFRMAKANFPMAHDEAYTFVAFSRSFFSALTDYSKPNNHVLHTILVYFSTSIFGLEAWAVRLPAFVAGVLLVPVSYWLASRLYDRWTGLGTAFLVAWFPPLVAYANDARGYTMLALFTILTLALGNHVRRDKNLFFWALISLFSALGLFTVPIMLFPFGVLFVWLFLENQVSGPGPYRNKWEFLRYWLASGLVAAILTLLFYTPILVFTGPQKLFANDMLIPVPWKDLWVTFSARITDTWTEWTIHVPTAALVLLGMGLLLSVLFHRKIAQARVSLQLAALLWFTTLLLIKRPNAEPRFWVFLMPLVLLWASAGIFGILQKARLKFALGIPMAAPIFGMLLVYGFWQASWLVPQMPALWSVRGKQEKAVLFVQNHLQQDDMIVVSSPDDAAVWYYSELHGIPGAYFNSESSTYKRVLALVDTQWQQTLSWVLEDRGPDQAQLNSANAHLLGTIGTIQVYEVPHR
jgi:hypothetical protein